MSRSRKRPYAAVCGNGSARHDKQMANRGVRHKQNAWLRNSWHEEEMGLIPHRYECRHNNAWSWGRESKQRLCTPRARDWSEYCRIAQGLWRSPREEAWVASHGKDEWPPRWFEDITRK